MLDTLAEFCSGSRQFLNLPLRFEDHLYASDGAMAIRVSAESNKDYIHSNEKAEKLKLFFVGHHKIAEWEKVEIPSLQPDMGESCCGCGGVGWSSPCTECQESGRITCKCCGVGSDCEKCDGCGWARVSELPKTSRLVNLQMGLNACSRCNGTGREFLDMKPKRFAMFGMIMDLRRLTFIVNLFPDVKWALGNDSEPRLFFRSDVVEGILMPCSA